MSTKRIEIETLVGKPMAQEKKNTSKKMDSVLNSETLFTFKFNVKAKLNLRIYCARNNYYMGEVLNKILTDRDFAKEFVEGFFEE